MEEIRALPSAVETEQTLLGCILNNTQSFLEVDGYLNESDFYASNHKEIYKAIKYLIHENIGIDLITFLEYLKKNNLIDKCGGVTYVTELFATGIGYSLVSDYAKIIKEKSSRRKLIKAGRELSLQAYDEDINMLVENISDELLYAQSSKQGGEIIGMQEAMEESLKDLEERYQNKGKLRGISSGFKELDKLSSGLRRTDFMIIAARPSMGKTAFALNIGQAASQYGSVAIFSIEMSRAQLMDRLLAARCFINYDNVKNGNLNDNEWNKIMQEAGSLEQRKLFIDDESRMLSDIKARCRKVKIQKGLDVVIIDYLQLIRVSKKTQSREQEVSYISQELKALAKELDITVIALAQLSRAPEQRPDHRPKLSDLRESGSIEQDADIINFIYRDEYYNPDTEDKNIAEIITAKDRNGITATTKLVWIGKYQRFGSLDVIR
ncbi:replicative DNA helicase [Clostridium sp. BJN0001]|uniref:replicative DNA helicase n=1 Tax=Clostridium sp. BJN0001 TaxID=2930219 RepID=UPI001FD3970F|nr:replicative DNA helicase [Clostridium sp. BJN0001]